jgi:UMF1 family MFS transporter
VVIALAAVYAEQVMGFEQQETMALVFLVNIASAAGAFLFGYAEDRIGHKPALAVTLVAWIVMVLIASFTTTRALFWVAATLAGLCMGSSQSCGRALVGVLAPATRLGEFYGLWAFATRLAAVVGPLTYGLVSWVTAGNHRIAFLTTGLFFVLGLILLARLDLERGARAAQAEPG